MLSYIKNIFTLDYRSLALLRISIGITLVFDLAQRAHSLFAHYTDGGVLPRAELFRLWNESAFLSLYYINGTTLFTAILFLAGCIFALMMIAGYRTRLATICSFVLLISLHNRNPLVLQGGDVALRVILFWMMFLPLSRRMSMDMLTMRTKYAEEKDSYFDWPGFAYVIQFLLIWVFTGLLKDGAPWISTHTAVAMALSLDTFTTSFGNWLRTVPEMLRYLTLATISLEKFSWVLFISPIKTGWVRLIGLILLTGLVIGFNMSFRLGTFGLIMFSISLGLLPRVFWDKIVIPLRDYLSRKSMPGVTIFYDGDCGFCSRMSNLIKRLILLHPDTMVVMASSDPDAYSRMHRAHSWVIRDTQGRSYTGFRAFVALVKSSWFFRIFTPLLILKPFMIPGEEIYRMVADNSPKMCFTIHDGGNPKLAARFKNARNISVVVLITLVVSWNIYTLPQNSDKKFPFLFEKILVLPRLDQKWNMFAPYPTTEDGFYVIPGVLRDGTVVDVYSGDVHIEYGKPNRMAWMYQDQRWQKYMMNLWLKNYADYRLGYGRYLCREWNNRNPFEKNLMSFDIVYMLEETDFNTLQEKPLTSVVLWQHSCFE